MDRDATTKPRTRAGNLPDQAPRVADALKRGIGVSVRMWSGREVLGTVSDRDPAGLLLSVGGDEEGAGGYAFLPWTSVERVDIPEVESRRVKSLRS